MNNDVQNGPSTLPFRNLSRSRHISAPPRPAPDAAAIVLPFAVLAETVDAGDGFEIDILPAKESRILAVRFIPPGQARPERNGSTETRIMLPTGGLLLLSFRRASGAGLARPISL